MATAGSVLGGYLTYRMARKGGKETLEKRFPPEKIRRIYAIFERFGFAAVAIPALLPPPVPIVPMLLAAGALQYPPKKFLTALTVGRAARYTLLAYLGFHYGRRIVQLFSQYYMPTLLALIAFSIVAAFYAAFEFKRRQKPAGAHASPRKRRVHRRTT